MSKIDISHYMMKFIGTEYVWGGKTVRGWDCSGICSEALQAFGHIPLHRVMNSQMLHNYLTDRYYEVEFPHDMSNAVLFFGKSRTQITHIAIAIDSQLLVEASGEGRPKSNSKNDSGWVRIRPIKHRRDLLLALDLDAPMRK